MTRRLKRDRERLRLLDAGINDARRALLNPAVKGERRELLHNELQSLRLIRVGVVPKHAAGYLRMAGIVPAGRRPPRLHRGPEVWGDKTRVRVVGSA